MCFWIRPSHAFITITTCHLLLSNAAQPTSRHGFHRRKCSRLYHRHKRRNACLSVMSQEEAQVLQRAAVLLAMHPIMYVAPNMSWACPRLGAQVLILQFFTACECVYSLGRQRPGLRTGAVDNLNRRIGTRPPGLAAVCACSLIIFSQSTQRPWKISWQKRNPNHSHGTLLYQTPTTPTPNSIQTAAPTPKAACITQPSSLPINILPMMPAARK